MPRSEMDVCEFLSGFLPEEMDDELLAYAAEKYCKSPPVTKYNEPARRFYLEERLRSLKMREGEGFEEFFWGEFVPVYEELADLGRKLDEETLVFLILNALPDSWSGFVEVVVLLGLDMLSVDDVCLKIACEELEGEFRADNRHVINLLGMDKYMQLRDLRASGKMKDSREESEKLSAKVSNLSIQDANARVAPSSVQKNRSRKTGSMNNNGEATEACIMGSSLTFVDANEKIAPRGVPDTRSQQQPRSSKNLGNKKNESNQEATILGSSLSHEVPKGKPAHRSVQDTRSHPQGSRSLDNRKQEQLEEIWVCGSSLTFEDANGRSNPPGPQRSQPQNPRTNGNRKTNKKAKEMWVRVVDPY